MSDQDKDVVAFIGTGGMGHPMAANLARARFPVRAWNRTPSKSAGLADAGVVICDQAADAVEGAAYLITMLADGPATESVVRGILRPGLLWAQMSTVGEAWTESLAKLAADAGASYVDAPVLGTVGPAERGELVIIAGGSDADRTRLEPLFKVLGQRTVAAGAIGDATRLKMILNLWSLLSVTAMAEAVSLAEGSGVDPRTFLEVITGGGSDSVYARSKAELMLRSEYPRLARLRLVQKDLRLAVEQGKARGRQLPLATAAVEVMQAAIQAGFGDMDAAAVIEGLRRPLPAPLWLAPDLERAVVPAC